MPVEIVRVSKRNDWYTVEGWVDGRVVSVDLPAPNVDPLSREAARDTFRRALVMVARARLSEGS